MTDDADGDPRASPGAGSGEAPGEASDGDADDVTVRRATEDDLDRLVLFNQAMAREAEGRELDRSRLRKGVEAVLEDPDRAVYFLAEKDDELVGQIAVTLEWSDWRNAHIWWIQNVYVSKLHRREGIYRTLHEHVRERARKAEAAGLRLVVDRDNRPARETYRSLGMRPSHYMMFEEMWK